MGMQLFIVSAMPALEWSKLPGRKISFCGQQSLKVARGVVVIGECILRLLQWSLIRLNAFCFASSPHLGTVNSFAQIQLAAGTATH